MGPEEKEALVEVLRHNGMTHVFNIIEEIVQRMQRELVTVPIPEDAEKAAFVVLGKRLAVQGAVSLQNALFTQLNNIRYSDEEEGESHGNRRTKTETTARRK